jgi:transposase
MIEFVPLHDVGGGRSRRPREPWAGGVRSSVPLVFAPGDAFQFDWSEDWAMIDGERVKLQVAHAKLCYSRAFVLHAYLLQTQEMLFDAHNHAFVLWAGVPRRGIYECKGLPHS